MRGVMRAGCSRLVVSVVAVMLHGCVFPHTQRWAPELSGVVRARSEPLAGVAVTYAHRPARGPDCEGVPSASALTNERGEFHFEAGEEFMWILPVGDTIYGHELCIQLGDRRELLWTYLGMGGQPPALATVSCDVDLPVQDIEGGSGRCEVQW